MRALISPQENNRILEIRQTEFQVASPLFWVGCPIDAELDWKYTPELGIHKPATIRTPILTFKQNKKLEIESKFAEDSISAVSALSLNWTGGFDSAIKFDAAMRLSEASGQSSVVFFDINNIGHNLTFQQALQVTIQVAGVYQFKLAKRNSIFKLIDSATSESEINNITW